MFLQIKARLNTAAILSAVAISYLLMRHGIWSAVTLLDVLVAAVTCTDFAQFITQCGQFFSFVTHLSISPQNTPGQTIF